MALIGKFLLVSGLVSLVVAMLARGYFSRRPLEKVGRNKVRINGRKLAEAVLIAGKSNQVVLQEKRLPFLPVSSKKVTLLPKQAASQQAGDVAECALRAAMGLIAEKKPDLVKWRTWAVKFATSAPAFGVVVLVFAGVAGRVGGGLFVGLAGGMVLASVVALALTLQIEREAAKIVLDVLEQRRPIQRLDEEEDVALAVKAASWRRLVPFTIW